MSKAKPAEHAEAALIALADECVAAAKVRDEAADQLEEAEAQHRPIAPPPAILKTQRDAELGPFAGPGIGAPYVREDIDLIRPLVRRSGRTSAAGATNLAVRMRGLEILEAWPAWRAAVDAQGWTSRPGRSTPRLIGTKPWSSTCL
jgi:hypothetical protein